MSNVRLPAAITSAMIIYVQNTVEKLIISKALSYKVNLRKVEVESSAQRDPEKQLIKL
jgi:hypothetical protein